MYHSARAIFSTKSLTLRFPTGSKDRVSRVVHVHQGRGSVIEQAPFHRQLDLWMCSIAVAVARGLSPLLGKGEKFVDTQSVDIGDAVAEMLLVLAVHHFGPQDEQVANPTAIIEIANGYAAAGLPIVLEWLESGELRQSRMDSLISHVQELRSTTMQSCGISPG